MLIISYVVEYERSTFAKQESPQRKGDCPRKSADQIYPEKSGGGEIGYTENYRQNNSEAVGKTGDKCHKVSIFFNKLESLTKFFGYRVETFEQALSSKATKIEITLITNKGTCPGSAYDCQNIKIALEREKTGEEKDCFPLQKGAYEQNPVSVEFQVFFENLLNMHHQPLICRMLNGKAPGDF